MNKIAGFNGQYRWLSNFWFAEVKMYGETYRSVENAYQAAKKLNALERLPFQTCDAKTAKQLGKQKPIRADWEQVREGIMLELIRRKFFGHPELAERLLNTGDVYIEESLLWHDRFWGNCICGSCPAGQNKLGHIIMQVREELKER